MKLVEEQKKLVEIACELRQRVEDIRSKRDHDTEASKPLQNLLPTWLIRPVLSLVGFLSGHLHWTIKALGVKPAPFGSFIVTSVGAFGIKDAFAPLGRIYNCGYIFLLGAVEKKPVVVESKSGDTVTIRKMMNVCVTVDHRYTDGYLASKLMKRAQHYAHHPEEMDDK